MVIVDICHVIRRELRISRFTVEKASFHGRRGAAKSHVTHTIFNLHGSLKLTGSSRNLVRLIYLRHFGTTQGSRIRCLLENFLHNLVSRFIRPGARRKALPLHSHSQILKIALTFCTSIQSLCCDALRSPSIVFAQDTETFSSCHWSLVIHISKRNEAGWTRVLQVFLLHVLTLTQNPILVRLRLNANVLV